MGRKRVLLPRQSKVSLPVASRLVRARGWSGIVYRCAFVCMHACVYACMHACMYTTCWERADGQKVFVEFGDLLLCHFQALEPVDCLHIRLCRGYAYILTDTQTYTHKQIRTHTHTESERAKRERVRERERKKEREGGRQAGRQAGKETCVLVYVCKRVVLKASASERG